ncbi:MAG: glycosyltransferase family 9 protein [Flavobacteriales bacterium]|jgi:ADP-heptose:LPS heptosyltransferase|nr:glycosyltransferase family 9 protein [Flavobacteriales bacterium]
MTKPKHILVIRLSALGDVAMTVPVLRVLAKTYPDIRVTVLSRPFFKPLFEELSNVQFLEADVYGTHKNIGLLKLANEAKALGVTAVADLHNVIRSKVIRNYLILTGLQTAAIDKGRTEKKALTRANPDKKLRPLRSMHQRYAEVFQKLGCSLDLDRHEFPPKKELSPLLHELIGKHAKKLIGIAPFAAYEGKKYPLSHMTQVIKSLDATGKYKLFLFGAGHDEIKLLRAFETKYKSVTNMAGRVSFEEELKLISNLDGMLSMDSANGHLAALYGIPVLTLWGVTHPYLGFTPFGQPNTHQLVSDRGEYPLIPTSVYGNKAPNGYDKAMESIPPAKVVARLEAITNS